MGWSCDCCGLCCRQVGSFPQMSEYALEDGSCKYLDKDNRCSIYDRRPLVCNVAEAYKLFFKDRMSEDEYYDLQSKSCAQLKNEIISIVTPSNDNDKEA